MPSRHLWGIWHAPIYYMDNLDFSRQRFWPERHDKPFSPKLIDNMEVLTGGLPVEYGERLAAVVNLNSRRPPEEGEGQIELQGGSFDTVNPSLFYGKRIGAWSVLAGGSYRTTSRALDPAVPDLVQHSGGDE